MWVSGHAGIQGNEKADQHAKATLQGETNKNYKTVAKLDKGETGRNKTSSENPTVIVKQRIKKNTGAQALTRKDEVIILRLRMGYTRHTHGWTLIHRLNVEIVELG
jgi:hypothetical protein